MAKLYWRVKIDGKWTWQPVVWIDNEKEAIKDLIDQVRILPPEESQ